VIHKSFKVCAVPTYVGRLHYELIRFFTSVAESCKSR